MYNFLLVHIQRRRDLRTMLKVYINCKSQLLQKSLEIFLKKYLTPYKKADVVLSDRPLRSEKTVVTIGNKRSDKIQKPFTQSSLLFALDRVKKSLENQQNLRPKEEKIDLEIQIEKLTQKFAKDLAHILKSRIDTGGH